MATADRNDSTPDSWDQGFNEQSNDVSVSRLNQNFSSLNVNASEFVPGIGTNVFASEFVPSYKHDRPPDPILTDGIDSHIDSKVQNSHNTLTDDSDIKKDDQSEVADNWADEDDDDDDLEDDDDAMETDSSEASTKPVKKPAVKVAKVKRHHVNVVFIGHVDAGKSTIGGHLMYLTGMVEKRTLEKYEREAKLKSRETWYLSWALDTNQEERDKGKTVEVGRAYFETEKKHFTILDAPGHKSFVPNMISGASQADVAVLVISARRGEFEAGLDRGGQTREHAMLAKTAGVKHLVILINKMDDPTVEWDELRYNECKDGLVPCLKKCGFNPKTDFQFMPVSGLTGAFLKEPASESICPWYRGPCLIDYMDNLPILERMATGPIRLPIVDKFRDMGTIVLGKMESGTISRGQLLMLMPNRTSVEVMQLFSDEDETESVVPGENVKVKLKGLEEEDISPGFVLCSPESLCNTSSIFDAQIVILEHKSIICAGYSAVLHIHACAEEITIKGLLCLLDKKTGERTQIKPRFIKQDQAGIARLEVNGGTICLETFKDFPQMGRFTLRDEGKTIAIGKVLKLRD